MIAIEQLEAHGALVSWVPYLLHSAQVFQFRAAGGAK